METLTEQTIGSFLETLASSSPTPGGGGSVAAMTGAMAAGLVSMVCALTVGKKQYAEFSAEAQAIQHQALAIQKEFQELAQADIDIFGRLSATYKLPRTTDADAASRREAIQTVTRAAADVPLRVARTAISLCLAIPRARRRFARFAHAIKRMTPTAANNSNSIGLIPLTMISRNSSIFAPRPAFSFGYACAS